MDVVHLLPVFSAGTVRRNRQVELTPEQYGRMAPADTRIAIAFALSPGNVHDAPQGRRLPSQLAADHGFIPVVPPKRNRTAPWEYDRELYQRRNEVECLFRRLKGFRRVFPRFDSPTSCSSDSSTSRSPSMHCTVLTRPNGVDSDVSKRSIN